jgi:hypothetical protein
VRHLGAIGFVFGESLRAERRLAAFKDRRNIIRLEAGHELPEHVVKDENGLGREAAAGAHRWRAAAGAGMEGTKNKAKAIDEEETGNWQHLQDKRMMVRNELPVSDISRFVGQKVPGGG